MATLHTLDDSGQWCEVGGMADPLAFEPETPDAAPETLDWPTRSEWSLDFTMTAEDAARLRETLDRHARAARWRDRLWLRFPIGATR